MLDDLVGKKKLACHNLPIQTCNNPSARENNEPDGENRQDNCESQTADPAKNEAVEEFTLASNEERRRAKSRSRYPAKAHCPAQNPPRHPPVPGRPSDNALVEAFNWQFRQECLNEYWITSLDDASAELSAPRHENSTQRPHCALDYQTRGNVARKHPVLKPLLHRSGSAHC